MCRNVSEIVTTAKHDPEFTKVLDVLHDRHSNHQDVVRITLKAIAGLIGNVDKYEYVSLFHGSKEISQLGCHYVEC